MTNKVLNYYGHGERWEDLRFPAQTLLILGIGQDPSRDATDGLLVFDAASTERVFVQAQLPHGWKEGTALRPHVHWMKTTSASGNVLWQLDYKWAPIGEVMDADFTTLSSSMVANGDNDTVDEHLVTSLGSISGIGKSVSDMLVMKLSRIGGDAADTYGADCRLLEFDIHHVRDSLGSIEEFTKAGIEHRYGVANE